VTTAADEALVRRAVVIGTRLGGSGLSGLREAFVRIGRGATFDSWVAIGANEPIAPTDISNALADSLPLMARAARLEPTALAQMLAGLLPRIVDEMTPDGVLPPPQPGLFGRLRRFLRGAA
jgi:uncharacterized protein YidB (DUF937 family)